jgi:hypothetical protein
MSSHHGIAVQISGYLPISGMVTSPGKLLDNPVCNPKPAALAERFSQCRRRKLTQRAGRARASPRTQVCIVIVGAGKRIASHHRLQQLFHHLTLKLVRCLH